MADEIIGFDDRGFRRAVAAIRKIEALPTIAPPTLQVFPTVEKCVPFRNDSGAEMPAYGVARITGSVTVNGEKILTATKPDTTFASEYIANGEEVVPDGKVGSGYLNNPPYLLYDSGTPAWGEYWGPKPSQWTLSKGYPATTRVRSLYDSTNKWIEGSFSPIVTVIGKAGSDIAALSSETPGSGTVTAWYNNAGTFAATTFTFTGYNFSASVITASKYTVYNLVNGIWVAVFESCT